MRYIVSIFVMIVFLANVYAAPQFALKNSNTRKPNYYSAVSSMTATSISTESLTRTAIRIRTNGYAVYKATWALTSTDYGYCIPANTEYIDNVEPYTGPTYIISVDTNTAVWVEDTSNTAY